MIRKFLSKYILEVIPSIVATVVGAYIVTHYINAKPDAEKPKAEVAAPAPKADTVLPKAAKAEPSKTEPAKSEATKAAKNETIPEAADPRRPPAKDKTVAKAASVEPAPKAEKSEKAEDNRDANEIAREAIARLRGSEPVEAPRAQETVRTPEAPRTQPRVSVTYQPVAPAPIQPPVQTQVLTPAASVNPVPPLPEASVVPAPQPVARAEDSSRPMPPAEIPQRSLDIRAKPEARTSVAEDVVSAAKSVFQAVIPGTN